MRKMSGLLILMAMLHSYSCNLFKTEDCPLLDAACNARLLLLTPANKERTVAKALYVTSTSGIRAYSINHGTGALVELGGSPYPPLSSLFTSLAIAPGQKILNASRSAAGVDSYFIQSNGELSSPVNQILTVQAISNLCYDKTGRYLYFSTGSTFMNGYNFDPVVGAGAAVSGSPFGLSCSVTTLWSRRDFLYHTFGTTVSAKKINSGGTLSSVPGEPFAIGGTAVGAAHYFNRSQTFLWVTRGGTPSGIRTFQVAADGVIVENAALSMDLPVSTAISRVNVTSDERYLFLCATNSNAIYTLELMSNGLPVLRHQISQPGNPSDIVIDPEDRFAYSTSSAAGTLNGYSLSASGELTALPDFPLTIGSSPSKLDMSTQVTQE